MSNAPAWRGHHATRGRHGQRYGTVGIIIGKHLQLDAPHAHVELRDACFLGGGGWGDAMGGLFGWW